MHCSFADPALFCLCQSTAKQCKKNLKHKIMDTDLKIGNKKITTFVQFEGHPEGAKAIKEAKDHVLSELTDTKAKDVLQANIGLLSLYFRE